eukprot:10084356-Alexandrium_andersonii.AAC.1
MPDAGLPPGMHDAIIRAVTSAVSVATSIEVSKAAQLEIGRHLAPFATRCDAIENEVRELHQNTRECMLRVADHTDALQ